MQLGQENRQVHSNNGMQRDVAFGHAPDAKRYKAPIADQVKNVCEC